MTAIYLSALLLGLMGEIHCIGMCGPIALILPVDRKSRPKTAVQLTLYHLARIMAYGTMGLVLGFFGRGLQLAGLQQKISLIFGLIMIIVALFPAAGRAFSARTPAFWTRAVGRLKTAMQSYLQKRSYSAFFVMGFLNGYLPCGLVYLAMVGALATGSPWHGALYMMIFGLGTTPALMLITWLQRSFSAGLRNRLNRLIPYAVAFVGLLFVLRGLNLNIMFVSPGKQMLQVNEQKEKMFHMKMKKIQGKIDAQPAD